MLKPFTTPAAPRPLPAALRLPEILSALSFALDLTEGALPGHAVRCCLLGMRIARQVELPQSLMTPLYYALLLKDVGCSSNAARLTQVVGGDDRSVKSASKLADLFGGFGAAGRTVAGMWRNVLPEQSWQQRVKRMVALGVRRERNTREMIELRCERGSSIVRKLGLGGEAAEAVQRLDEHWDGSGYPGNLRADNIPVLARICTVAQHLDCFAMADGADAAIEALSKRRGSWFDPAICDAAAALHELGRLWVYCRPECPVEVTRRAVMELDPSRSDALAQTEIDTICEVFADVVDAKSPFTYRHSLAVADVAEAIAAERRLPAERVHLVRRAALLHDLGKLGVPNTILDKDGPLTAKECGVVREHPFLTRTVLERIASFEELAIIAGEHHEKLDGSGYPLGIFADQMRLESRIVAVADCFSALAEERPYRKAMESQEILRLLEKEAPQKLDANCLVALRAAVATWQEAKPPSLLMPALGEQCVWHAGRRDPGHSRVARVNQTGFRASKI